VQAAARIVELTNELGLNIGQKRLIINQAKEGQGKALENVVKDYNLDLVGLIPEDPLVRDYDLEGKPTMDLGAESIAQATAFRIFDSLIPEK
jgi:CO dehydrogenase maturation factor